MIKSPQQINVMSQGGKILAKVSRQLENMVRPGMATEELDKKAAHLIKSAGVQPSFLHYKGYPKNICVSVNEEVVHGIPSDRTIKNGDLVGIDLGIFYRGLHVDSAITVAVGKVDEQARKLLDSTKSALYEAIKIIKDGVSTYEIGKIIYETAKQNGVSSIKDLCGHGIGQNLQDPPSVFNFPNRKDNVILKEGMTICIEPMFSLGQPEVEIKKDKWTVVTRDRSLAAHFEHTVLVTKNGAEVLTVNDILL